MSVKKKSVFSCAACRSEKSRKLWARHSFTLKFLMYLALCFITWLLMSIAIFKYTAKITGEKHRDAQGNNNSEKAKLIWIVWTAIFGVVTTASFIFVGWRCAQQRANVQTRRVRCSIKRRVHDFDEMLADSRFDSSVDEVLELDEEQHFGGETNDTKISM